MYIYNKTITKIVVFYGEKLNFNKSKIHSVKINIYSLEEKKYANTTTAEFASHVLLIIRH